MSSMTLSIRLHIIALLLAAGLVSGVASAAPPPGAVRTVKIQPVSKVSILSTADKHVGAGLRTSLHGRIASVLVHPEPKRFINGRCFIPRAPATEPRR